MSNENKNKITPARRRALSAFRKATRMGGSIRIGNGADNSIHWRHAHWLIETKQCGVISLPGWDGPKAHLVRRHDPRAKGKGWGAF